MLSKEQLQSRMENYQQQRTDAEAQVHAFDGAIMELGNLIRVLEKEEAESRAAEARKVGEGL